MQEFEFVYEHSEKFDADDAQYVKELILMIKDRGCLNVIRDVVFIEKKLQEYKVL